MKLNPMDYDNSKSNVYYSKLLWDYLAYIHMASFTGTSNLKIY
jgi:hypothetical protein